METGLHDFRVNRIFSARLVVAVLLVFSAAVCSSSQTTSEKVPNASISGKVTIKDKGVAGIVVFAEEQNATHLRRNSLRATTDSTGSYRITNVSAGTYLVRPVAPSFALEDYSTNNALVVNEGEIVEDINFSMVPGGVITGKITDADGKPLIEEYVNVMPINAAVVDGRWVGSLHTDDRGIYRAFGLRPGKYQVFVGQNESLPRGPRPAYRQTFYPSVTDSAKATVIEVTQGSETANIDIVVGRPVTTFRVSGRILDAETGKPLLNVNYGVYQRHGEHGGSSTVSRNSLTNANGEFRLDNVLPGKYVVFIVPAENGIRGDSVSFEVVDHDVSDLVINAGTAASLSGVVVFEGTGESAANIKTNDLIINAWVENTEEFFGGSFSHSINPDGSFRIGGLRKGRVRIGFASQTMNDRKPVALARVERDGVVQPGGITLKDGEHVTGLRLVVKYLTGAIHGQIKIEGDELLPNSRLSIWIDRLDPSGDQYSSGNSPQLDSRKRFAMEGLAAGTYEVNVAVYGQGRSDTTRIFKQEVIVTDNAVSDVTITIKKQL